MENRIWQLLYFRKKKLDDSIWYKNTFHKIVL